MLENKSIKEGWDLVTTHLGLVMRKSLITDQFADCKENSWFPVNGCVKQKKNGDENNIFFYLIGRDGQLHTGEHSLFACRQNFMRLTYTLLEEQTHNLLNWNGNSNPFAVHYTKSFSYGALNGSSSASNMARIIFANQNILENFAGVVAVNIECIQEKEKVVNDWFIVTPKLVKNSKIHIGKIITTDIAMEIAV